MSGVGGAALAKGWWSYTAGPFLGAVLGGAAYMHMAQRPQAEAEQQ
jgi:hypothetical protein